MQATRPIDQANLLNACFHSVFAPPDHGSTLNYLHQLNYSVQHKLCELKLSVNNIFKQLKLLDINKASLGLPTKFTVPSPKLLQRCAQELSPSLCRLFDMALELRLFLKNEKMLISSLFIKD